jgi:nitrogen fixation protein FixH
MSPTALPTARRRHGLQGRHVLWTFLAFFAAIFAVNGAMIYAAVSTHTGLVANEPYRKGLHYNERIAADARQANLGWTEKLVVDRNGHVELALSSADGHAIRGLLIKAVLGRPATQGQDIQLALSEMEPGRYEAQASMLPAGSWLISLEARTATAADPIYRARRRLWLKP